MTRRALLLLAALLVAAGFHATAQTADDTTSDTETPAPPGSTVITSDELHSDQMAHISIFSGNVVVTGTNFRMTCREMTVNFTKDNKIDNIVATGDVVITQPGRITHCGRAQYFRDDDKFVLTESPSILQDGKNQLSSGMITIYRTTQKLETAPGRTVLVLGPGAMGSPKSTGTTTPTP